MSAFSGSSDECQICCQNLNKSTRKEITCPKCQYVCCVQCIENYLIHNAADFHCMKCKMIWTRCMIFDNLPKIFLNEKWKPHQEEIFFTRETSYIPNEQELSKTWFTSTNRKKQISERIGDLRDLIDKTKREIRNLEDERKDLNYISNTLEATGEMPNSEREDKIIKKEFIQPCPAENCTGYLSKAWKCPMCERYTCSKCLELVGSDRPSEENHTCEEGQFKNAELIRKDSKKCPKCGVYIYRIAGCVSMYCTICHTGFRWDTLQITNEGQGVHNPHYYEYLANLPQNQNICDDGPIPPHLLLRTLESRRGNCPKSIRLLPRFHRSINEVANHRLMHYHGDEVRQNFRKSLRLARWRYINKGITKNKWKSLIFHHEKMAERNHEIDQILEMFVTCGNDVFRKYVEGAIDYPENAMKELKNLLEYVNTTLKKMSLLYWTKVPIFRQLDGDRDTAGFYIDQKKFYK